MHSYFNNKVVVISGGCGGLGIALTEELLLGNAKVVAIDLNLQQQIVSPDVLYIEADITSEEQVKNAYKKFRQRFGKIDVLINNAGITHMSKVTDTSMELFEKVQKVNVFGSVLLTKVLLNDIISNQGHIASISSVAGFAPLYARAAYAASKHAMEGFFRSLDAELREYGVTSTIVCPSFVNTRPELKAQVNNGVSSPGATKKNTNGETIAPNVAAKEILKAMGKKKKTLLLGKVSKIAFLLSRLFPNYYLNVMSKGAKKEFD